MNLKVKKKFQPVKESILETFKEVLMEDPSKVLYDKDKDYLTYHVESHDTKIYEQQIWEKVLLLEIKELFTKNLIADFVKLSYEFNKDHLFITHVICGSREEFFKTIFGSDPCDFFLGAKVYEIGELEKNVFVFVVSSRQNADIPDFKAAIKITK